MYFLSRIGVLGLYHDNDRGAIDRAIDTTMIKSSNQIRYWRPDSFDHGLYDSYVTDFA